MSETPEEKKISAPPEGRAERRHAVNSLSNPIFQTATFTFGSAAELAAFHSGESEGFFYSRYGNPTTHDLYNRIYILTMYAQDILFFKRNGIPMSATMILPICLGPCALKNPFLAKLNVTVVSALMHVP